MLIGVPTERYPEEQRVALVPNDIPKLIKAGLTVAIEQGAGTLAGFSDKSYEEQEAQILSSREKLFSSSDIILQVHGPNLNSTTQKQDLDMITSSQILIGMLDPFNIPDTLEKIAEKNVTSFALELLPRITRAQPMDTLTSMATVSGYKAVILAAQSLPKMYPMMMTAAGTITPARVLVIGVGVAGLQAIATSKRLGAVVQAYDIRPAVKDQVQSLGAKFVELEIQAEGTESSAGYAKSMDEEFYKKQQDLMTEVISESDVVISTAAVPGKKAPILITKAMVEGMKAGSIIIDLAAEAGGNCELTKPGDTVTINGITIEGPLNLPSTIPQDASQMYSRNLSSFVNNLIKNGEPLINMSDQIISDTLLTHLGDIINPRIREHMGLQELKSPINSESDIKGENT